jgi:hypothetical protein
VGCKGSGFPPRRSGFEPGSGNMGFVVDKAALDIGFLQVLRFPLPLITPTAPHSSSSIIRDWYSRPVVASVIVVSVPLHPTKDLYGSGRG